MRIIQIMPGKVWGGAEQYILDLSKALRARGNSVEIYVRNSRAVVDRMKREGDFRVLPFSFVLDPRAIRTLTDEIKSSGVDIIHVHNTAFVPSAIIANANAGGRARVFFTRHDARSSAVNPLFRGLFKRLHRAIFVSQLTKDLWCKANPWMPDARCVVLHNSIPTQSDAVTESDFRHRLGVGAGTPLLVFTGRVRKSKGCSTIVEALSMIRNLPFQMVFVGRCKPESYGRKLLEEAGRAGLEGRVNVYGFVPDVRSLIREADIGIAPSIMRESSPLSQMEFMQAGKCLIASDNGGQAEFISNGKTGLLVPPDDPAALSTAIKSAIENRQLRLTLGENARRYFNENMNYDKYLDDITAIYNSPVL